ncbi:hypothetical protein [Microbacterium soli]|uniref:DUF3137 domain-containing protein n=1 Tax=Microbacterium soli TaxID=446075 RepID=A0ABP7N358_9MICO
MTAQTYPFDTRALTDPVDARSVAEFWRGIRAKRPSPVGAVVVWIIIGVVGVMILLPMLGLSLFSIALAGDTGPARFAVAVPVLLTVVIAAVGIPLAFRAARIRRVTAFRIAQFAAANGMTYEHRVDDPPLPGMIFQRGSSRVATSLVRGHSPRFVEFGNHQYTTGSGKNRTTHTWGYVAVKLDVPLPNIVLDALGNNTLGTNLPASFSRDQRLSLEGDFDRYFSLYCPQGYEADALYLFTPDVMARFIDHAAQLDVEIVDDWMFLYMQRQASTTDAATWAWLFGAVGALMTKFDQWARWRDDRLREAQAVATSPAPVSAQPGPSAVGAEPSAGGALPFAPPAGMLTPPPGVAVQGRRLRRTLPWMTIVVVLLVIGFTVVPHVLGALGMMLLR